MNQVYIILFLLSVIGLLVFIIQKAKNKEALAQNDKTLDKVKDVDKQIDTNNTALKTEQDKLKEDEKKDVDQKTLLDFINDPNK